MISYETDSSIYEKLYDLLIIKFKYEPIIANKNTLYKTDLKRIIENRSNLNISFINLIQMFGFSFTQSNYNDITDIDKKNNIIFYFKNNKCILISKKINNHPLLKRYQKRYLKLTFDKNKKLALGDFLCYFK